MENTFVPPISFGGLADLIFGSIGVDDAVLAGDLFAIALAVGIFFLLVVAQFALEFGLDGVDLALLHVARPGAGCLVGVICEELELVSDAAVEGLRVGDNAFELLGCRTTIGFGQGALVQGCNYSDIVCEGSDLIAEELNPTEEVLLRERVVRGRLSLRIVLQLVLLDSC